MLLPFPDVSVACVCWFFGCGGSSPSEKMSSVSKEGVSTESKPTQKTAHEQSHGRVIVCIDELISELRSFYGHFNRFDSE